VSEILQATSVYLSSMSVTRDGLAPTGPGQAQLSFAFSNPEVLDGALRMGSKLDVAIYAESESDTDEEVEPFCQISVEYVAEMQLADGSSIEGWQEHVSLADLNRFVVTTTYPLHRSRIMETTMHMEIPVLRMPQILEPSDAAASSDFDS
jgi:uncharacterized protein YqfB (UPF0267 family)